MSAIKRPLSQSTDSENNVSSFLSLLHGHWRVILDTTRETAQLRKVL